MKKESIVATLFYIVAGWAAVFPTFAYSQATNFEVLKALSDLRTKQGNLKVEWYPAQNRVKTLKGALSEPLTGTPEDAAFKFLSEKTAIFQIENIPMNLQVGNISTSAGGHIVRFKQIFEGLPVFNGKIEVNLKKDNSVFLIHNSYLPHIDLATSPTLSESAAVDIAKADFFQNCSYRSDKSPKQSSCGALQIILREENSQLGILEVVGKPVLAYDIVLRFDLNDSLFALVQYKIDALLGEVIEKKDLIQNADGAGKVFNPNPVNTLNNIGLVDDADSNSAVPAGAYFSKKLKDITETLGQYYLIGPYVDVDDSIEKPHYFILTLGSVTSTSGKFNYQRSSNKFEHPMAYYHIDTNQRYIQSLGFSDINNRSIRVDPHGLSGADNSHYVADPPGVGYLAFGEGGVDDAEDADIILHEYGHSIQDNQSPGKYAGCSTEAGAMGEGFGDFWAASNTQSISGFDPACVGEWDQTPNCLRRVDGTKHYPRDMTGECHADGEIWSAALLDILKALGKTTTHKLVLQSHYLVPDQPTFFDGAQALIDADEILNDGNNRDTICRKMKKRGIMICTDGEIGCPDAAAQLFFNAPIKGGGGTFSTEQNGYDYDGATAIYFIVDGTYDRPAKHLGLYLKMYLDPQHTGHFRTDYCEGTWEGSSFYDGSCELVEDIEAGCRPLWLTLSSLGASTKSSSTADNLSELYRNCTLSKRAALTK